MLSEPASDLGATQNVRRHGPDMKIPTLKALSPTQSEPPFLGTQVVVMLIFIVLAILAAKRFPGKLSTQPERPRQVGKFGVPSTSGGASTYSNSTRNGNRKSRIHGRSYRRRGT